MLTVQETASIGLYIFCSFCEKCGRTEWRDYRLVMQEGCDSWSTEY